MIRIRLTASAERDVERATQWLDQQQPGLGKHFLLDLRHTLDRVGLFPNGYPTARPNVRRTLMARFPYALTYRSGDSVVLVLTVLHQKQQRSHPSFSVHQ